MAFDRRKWLIAAIGMASAVPLVRYNNGPPPTGRHRGPSANQVAQGSTEIEQQMPNTDGTYLTYVGGFLSGSGTSKVVGGAVNLTATVTTGDGVATTFSAPDLTITGDHFAGTATASGCSPLNIVGRFDGYKGDANFRGARILAYYTDGNGHNGKIGGVIVP